MELLSGAPFDRPDRIDTASSSRPDEVELVTLGSIPPAIYGLDRFVRRAEAGREKQEPLAYDGLNRLAPPRLPSRFVAFHRDIETSDLDAPEVRLDEAEPEPKI